MEKNYTPAIGLDVDGVLCCFTAGVLSEAKKRGWQDDFPENCRTVDHWDMCERFPEIMKDLWSKPEFWLSLPRYEKSYFSFTPDCYITSRRIDTSVTEEWLRANGFPEAPVITVKHPSEKLQHVQKRCLDAFVDDLPSTIWMLRAAGENGILFSAPFQKGHQDELVGLPVINYLDEVLKYV